MMNQTTFTPNTPSTPITSILEKAQAIVYNRFDLDTGAERPNVPFSNCMKKAAEIFNAINPFNGGDSKGLGPIEMYFALIALKFAREYFQHKQDNLVDICGYLAGLDDFLKEEANRNNDIPVSKY